MASYLKPREPRTGSLDKLIFSAFTINTSSRDKLSLPCISNLFKNLPEIRPDVY